MGRHHFEMGQDPANWTREFSENLSQHVEKIRENAAKAGDFRASQFGNTENNEQYQYQTVSGTFNEGTFNQGIVYQIAYQAETAERVRTPAAVSSKRLALEVKFNDPRLDVELKTEKYYKVVLKDLPAGVYLSSWLDENGPFFTYRIRDAQGKSQSYDHARHYLPWTLKMVETHGEKKPIDELRIEALQGYMVKHTKEVKQTTDGFGLGFASLTKSSHPYYYARRNASIPAESLTMLERNLRKSAEQSPNNPYFYIFLADVLAAHAVKRVIAGAQNGEAVNFDRTTIVQIEEARKCLQQAISISKDERHGNLRIPNLNAKLNPFGLNQYNGPARTVELWQANNQRPYEFWDGAFGQAALRDDGLIKMIQWIREGQLRLEHKASASSR